MKNQRVPVEVYEHLKTRVRYEPESGRLFWLQKVEDRDGWNKRFYGKECGTVDKICNTFYSPIRITFGGKIHKVYSHQLIWFIHFGKLPEQIDHLDGDGLNNRIINLRDSDRSLNARNSRLPSRNTSGFCGVTWDKQLNKWKAQVGMKGKTRYLGSFTDLQEAAAVAREFRMENGFTDRHGA